ncbi:hypothetical protein Q5H92_14045 [Hymenobacter sp. M29]|uniref:Uncharacterized protein n=1 Tax=Hymenobacter mellowenesis TaxID=3063995 RepID=A0ABT9AD67_9BACT|nr:hypothetical protein [Hymenobacter sp. M29]MDO7847488.1 hypothetical protein [Hymenobacter sp. M29]
MNESEQKIINTSLDQARTLHENIRQMWDGDTLATFYYGVISGAIARSGPEVAKALSVMLTEVYANTAKSHVDLGKLANGFANGKNDSSPASEPLG